MSDLQDRVMPYAEVKTIVNRNSRSAIIRYLNHHRIDWRPDADGNPVVSLSAWNHGFNAVVTTKDRIAAVQWDQAIPAQSC